MLTATNFQASIVIVDEEVVVSPVLRSLGFPMYSWRFPELLMANPSVCYGGVWLFSFETIELSESKTSRRIQELIVKSIFHFNTSALS
jgi:hypothetical protein